MPFSSRASVRQASSSLMRRRAAEREDEPDAVDIFGGGGRRCGRAGGRTDLPNSRGFFSPGAQEGWC